ncbi:MAG: tRNA (adenosine(37)-N6)-dimethylallyltransferase MiaA [Erysipelotrichaceae bacterium]|nr:tRNA (adenosine(37)-N6)-dimethylallyltransferase MiaA [Erysipelotrichaceae bacterium]
MYKVISVVGPTAVGKSDVAIKLAQRFNGEIINGDSVQVYRELNIGSAKIKEEEMEGIPHHLLDYVNIGEEYSVRHFQLDARKKIEEISERGKLPVVCGGTGLYIKAMLYDYDFVEMENTHEEYEDMSTQELYERLLRTDPKSTEKIHPNNRRRIVRALQLADSGNLKSRQEAGQQHIQIYDSFIVGLTMDRELLKKRIDMRVDMMMDNGLLAEVTALNEKYDWDAKGLQGIGYKEFREYFSGDKTLEETVKTIKTHTRQFAKRQYTWWNHQMPVRWYDVTEEGYLERIIEDIREWRDGKSV